MNKANWSDIKKAYLTSKQDAWSYTTYKSEASRLANIADEYLPADPAACYQAALASGATAYSAKTLLTRASELVQFAIDQKFIRPQANAYKAYMRDKARLFKGSYVAKRPKLTFDEARGAIASWQASPERTFALELLSSGLRLSEAFNVNPDGTVTGKGGKRRAVFNAPTAQAAVNVSRLRRLLAAHQLTPHLLRKLAATKAVELGARESDLLSLFGWSSMQTASLYITTNNNAGLSAQLKEAVNG